MNATYHSIVPLTPVRVVGAPDTVSNLDFGRGAFITEVAPTPWILHVEADTFPLTHMLGGPIPMASQQLLDVLTATGADNLQAFPALVRHGDEEVWHEYWALNVLGVLEATDLATSEGTTLAEDQRGPTRIAFRRLVLSRSRTLGLPIFRLAHDPSILLLSDRVLAALDEHRPPEGWGFATVEVEMADS